MNGQALTPDYDLSINGTSFRSKLNGRAVAITLTDETGTSSDTLSFEIEVGDRSVAIPRKGAVITVALGYVETGLQSCGLFTADEVRITLPPLVMSVSAKAADMRGSLKEHRTEAYEDLSIGAIVDKIASRHGLVASVDSALGNRIIPYLGQTEESDLHFLTRLARDHGAIAAPKNGRLVFARKGSGHSVSGLSLATLTLTPDMCSGGVDIQLPDRPVVKNVHAHWHDRTDAKRKRVTASAGGDTSGFTLRHDFPNEDQAQAAADARAGELQRAGGAFAAEMPGNVSIKAGSIIRTRDFYPGCDLDWTVTSATHALTTSSFTTSIACEVKQ